MKSKHFKIDELIPLSMRNILHEDALWNLIDDNLIITIDNLKEKFPRGSMSINTYRWHGDRTQSGLRTKNSKYYSETSQHSLGKAVDIQFSRYNEADVRKYIIDHQDEFPLIGGLEDFEGMTWVHIDTRPRVDGKIKVFTA